MFWRFTPLLSQLDAILDKQDVKLSEVLNEDDVVLECKSHNQKLIDLIIIPENLNLLVRYVVSDPPEEVADETKFRLANIAGELLSADICEVNDTLVEGDDYLKYFYEFFLNEAPLNPLLASFVVKILNVLIQRKGERIVEYFQTKDDFVDRVILHIGTSAIMDFLLKFLQFPDPPSVKQQVLNWFVKSRLVPRLVEQFESEDDEKHFNACQCLTNLLQACRDQFSQSSSQSDMIQLHDSLECEETISTLLEQTLSGKIKDSRVVNGLSFIEALMEQKRYDSPLDSLVPPSQSELDRLESTTQTVIQCIVPKLSIFKSILESPPKQYYETMPTSCGVLSPPLGNTRLQVVHLIQLLYALDRHELNVALCAQNFLAVIQNLFFQYHWNSFLHKNVELLFSQIINVSVPQSYEDITQSESGDQTDEMKQKIQLLRQLLIDNQFIQKMLAVWQSNKEEESQPGGKRRGYMGHLSSLANHLQYLFTANIPMVFISELIKDLGEELIEKWSTFFNEEVTPLNNKNKIDHDITSSSPQPVTESFSRSESSSEEDDTDYKFPSSLTVLLQQNFMEYQNQPITSTFPETFGYNEDEFTENMEKQYYKDQISSLDFSIATPEDTRNATMFEQACNEEIRQFDDFEEESEIDMTEMGADADEEVDDEDTQDSDIKLNDIHLSHNSSHHIDILEKLSLEGILSSELNELDDIDLKNPHALRISRSADRRLGSGANRMVNQVKLKTNRSREFIPKSEIETSRKLGLPNFNMSGSAKLSPNSRLNRIEFVDDEDEVEDEEDNFDTLYKMRDTLHLNFDDSDENDDQDDTPSTSRSPRLKSLEKMDIDADEQASPNENNNSHSSDFIIDSPPSIDQAFDGGKLNSMDFFMKESEHACPEQSNNNSKNVSPSDADSSSNSPALAANSPLVIVRETEPLNHSSESKEEKADVSIPNELSTSTTSQRRSNIIIVRMNGTEYTKPLTSTALSDGIGRDNCATAESEDDNADKWDHIAEEARQLREQLDDIHLEDITLNDELDESIDSQPAQSSIPVLSDKRERYKERVEFSALIGNPISNGPTHPDKTTKFIAQNNSDSTSAPASSQTNGSD